MDNMETKNEKKRGLEGKHYVEKKRIQTPVLPTERCTKKELVNNL